MRKSVSLGAAMLLITAVLAAPVAAVDKVEICHLNGASDPGIPTLGGDDRTFELGMLKLVPPSAVPGHLGHGDSDVKVPPFDQTDGAYRTDTSANATSGLSAVFLAAELNGLRAWKHADCFITRNPIP